MRAAIIEKVTAEALLPSATRPANMSQVTAIRVANVPQEEFEEAVSRVRARRPLCLMVVAVCPGKIAGNGSNAAIRLSERPEFAGERAAARWHGVEVTHRAMM
jgi:hypothetical protein